MIAALNDVAAAVSSSVSLEDVLETIVDRAKWITNTEKATLVLTEEHSTELDQETMVVKGSRDEHPQEWWEAQLEDIAADVFSTGETCLALNKENDAWLLCAPIRVKDRPVGLLGAINSRAHPFTEDHIDFLAILAAFAATTIENSRLAEQTKYVLLASERDRIAREMHDGISQSLFSVALGLEVCKKQIYRDPNSVAERLNELQESVDLSRSELRRFIYDLRPVKLQELGLVGAVEYWIHEVTAGERVEGKVVIEGERRHMGPSAEACLYRVAKESVSNVVKHANAQSVLVHVLYTCEGVELRIVDDGDGFDLEAVRERLRSGVSLGLNSIEERVSRENGTIDIHSSVGSGTTVHVVLPG
ncbi:MAG: GAF domain-containing sensor histidine kinase [Actinomycetota bacterium]|nr:GAF domain-containing sensor histidine kinase [Actinomycetota bacterium]